MICTRHKCQVCLTYTHIYTRARTHCGPLPPAARDTVAIFGAIANIERQLQLHCLSNDKVIFVIVRAPIT